MVPLGSSVILELILAVHSYHVIAYLANGINLSILETLEQMFSQTISNKHYLFLQNKSVFILASCAFIHKMRK